MFRAVEASITDFAEISRRENEVQRERTAEERRRDVDSPPPLRLPIQVQSQLQFTTVGNGSRNLAEIAGAHVGNGACALPPLELKLIGEPDPGRLVGTTPGANEARSKTPRSINGRSLMNLRRKGMVPPFAPSWIGGWPQKQNPVSVRAINSSYSLGYI